MTPAELQEAIAIATQAVVGEPYVGPTAHNKLARAFLALRAQPSPAEVARKCAWLIGELEGGELERDKALQDAINAIRAYADSLEGKSRTE